MNDYNGNGIVAIMGNGDFPVRMMEDIRPAIFFVENTEVKPAGILGCFEDGFFCSKMAAEILDAASFCFQQGIFLLLFFCKDFLDQGIRWMDALQMDNINAGHMVP